MYVLTLDQGQGCTKGMHEKNECTLQESPKRNDGVPYSVHSEDIIIKKKKLQIRRQGSVGEKENKKMLDRGRVGAIGDLFRESPSCRLGPR